MAKPKFKLDVASQVPGRIRLKVPNARGNAQLLEQIGQTFAAIPGIRKVKCNPATGSVLLRYDEHMDKELRDRLPIHAPALTPFDELADKISNEADFLAQSFPSFKVVIDAFKEVDQQIKSATGNTMDLTIAATLGLILAMAVSGVNMSSTPVWLTLAIFAVNHAIELNSPAARVAATAPVVVKSKKLHELADEHLTSQAVILGQSA